MRHRAVAKCILVRLGLSHAAAASEVWSRLVRHSCLACLSSGGQCAQPEKRDVGSDRERGTRTRRPHTLLAAAVATPTFTSK